jgi:methionyl-tRNA formyltransferase
LFIEEHFTMRFAYAGFDCWRVVFEAFVAHGWEPVALYTHPFDNRLDSNDEMVSRARQFDIPVQLSKIRPDDLRALEQRDCDALIVGGYRWRIPDWSAHLRYAVNFHPSPLPEGRGSFPLTQAILEGRREWAISCHRVAPSFDTGALLDSERFALDADECYESLQLRLQMAARRLATRVARDFQRAWDESQPQGEGSYWPLLTDAQKTLDFTRPVDEVIRVVRACGLSEECLAPLQGTRVFVRRATAWVEAHDYTPGQIVHRYRRWIVIAAADGFVALIEWSTLSPNQRSLVGGTIDGSCGL